MLKRENKVVFECLAERSLHTEYSQMTGDVFRSLFGDMNTGPTFNHIPSNSGESHSSTMSLMICKGCSFETPSCKSSNVSLVASVSCLPSINRIPALHRGSLRNHKSFISNLLEELATTLLSDQLVSYLTQQNKPGRV